jgi:hypothetical protein
MPSHYAGALVKLTAPQRRALTKAADSQWFPYGGPEHALSARLCRLGLMKWTYVGHNFVFEITAKGRAALTANVNTRAK